MRIVLGSSLVLALCLCGCPKKRNGYDDFGDVLDGSVRADGSSPVNGSDASVVVGDQCAEEARWIYLVDSDNALMRYEPDGNTLTNIGTLNCPTTSTPFSMAVSRDAIAYVLFNDHKIYQVNTDNAACSATSFVPDQQGFALFGMGFVSDSAGSNDETLYIASSTDGVFGTEDSMLGAVNTSTWTLSVVGNVPAAPELTGNGNAELWGFFPVEDPMMVRQINKANGNTLQQFDVSEIAGTFAAPPAAWAFAFWGARYYIFYMSLIDESTSIYRLTPESGDVELVRADIGQSIVGAGVSTCAPVILY